MVIVHISQRVYLLARQERLPALSAPHSAGDAHRPGRQEEDNPMKNGRVRLHTSGGGTKMARQAFKKQKC